MFSFFVLTNVGDRIGEERRRTPTRVPATHPHPPASLQAAAYRAVAFIISFGHQNSSGNHLRFLLSLRGFPCTLSQTNLPPIMSEAAMMLNERRLAALLMLLTAWSKWATSRRTVIWSFASLSMMI